MTAAKNPNESSRPAEIKADSKEALLQAAKQVFADKGFDGATVKMLAEAADVNVALVSYHYGGKEGLFKACLEQFAQRSLTTADRALKDPQSAEEFRVRLQMYIEEFLQCHVDDPNSCVILHRETVDNPIVKEVYLSTFMKSFEKVVQFFASAQRKGFVRPNLNVEFIVLFMFGGLIHFVRTDKLQNAINSVSLNQKEFRDQVIRESLDMILRGVTPV